MGVVIGETAEIGDDCTLYQGVTLGGTRPSRDQGGQKRHPTIGNDVIVGSGAQVLGPIRVGDGARIGAAAVVLQEVPDGATMVGNPARQVGRRSTPGEAPPVFEPYGVSGEHPRPDRPRAERAARRGGEAAGPGRRGRTRPGTRAGRRGRGGSGRAGTASASRGRSREAQHQGTLRGHGDGRPRPARQRQARSALAEIAERQEISLSYLEQLFAKLRRGGLVKSVRGPGGGYLPGA